MTLLEAQRAHIRLLETLPRERIRTHEHRPDPLRQERGTGPLVPLALRERRRAVVAQLLGKINVATGKRWTYQQIGDEIGVTKASVAKYASSIRARRATP